MNGTNGYECGGCGELHGDVPMGYRLGFPSGIYPAGAVTFARDGELCVAEKDRFILANIELPVIGSIGEFFVWTCWFSLSHDSFHRFDNSWDVDGREDQLPAFGYLCDSLPAYPQTKLLKSYVHTRPLGLRPWVELEDSGHPLARELREGITRERILEIYHAINQRGIG